MSDERIWYAVNRITGRDLIGAGIFLMVSSVLVYIFGDHVNPDYAAIYTSLGDALICDSNGHQ